MALPGVALREWPAWPWAGHVAGPGRYHQWQGRQVLVNHVRRVRGTDTGMALPGLSRPAARVAQAQAASRLLRLRRPLACPGPCSLVRARSRPVTVSHSVTAACAGPSGWPGLLRRRAGPAAGGQGQGLRVCNSGDSKSCCPESPARGPSCSRPAAARARRASGRCQGPQAGPGWARIASDGFAAQAILTESDLRQSITLSRAVTLT